MYTLISVFLYFIYLNFRAGGMGLDACLCFFLRINDVRLRKEKFLRLGLRLKLPLHKLNQQLSSSLLRKKFLMFYNII
jgi:hypothetical protein